ncbi:MAG TPA: S8 family serine peptidase [Mycobacteriales bacterium]|nr:S8 family serine peptidase [Mycobacteriales bacterium]
MLPALLLVGMVLWAGPAAAAVQPRTWHGDQARVTAAQAPGRNGSGVLVAVIDTYVDGSHPAFGGRVLAGADCVNGCRAGAAAPDACEHGTHVAGTVAASDYGVAPAARILPLRVLAYDPAEKLCTGSSDDAAAAIRFAVRAGAKIINLSLGGSVPLVAQDPDMINAVSEAADAGIVVIFAAGNKSFPVTDQYGGDALIVAATDNAGRLPTYSQRGSGVDLAAPGGNAPSGTCTADTCVASLWPNGEYAAMAGTSMAAPHVAGLAALLIAQAPSRGRADVIAAMRSTARPLADAGSGLIDMAAALRIRGGGSAPAPAPRPSASTAAPRPAPKPAPAPSRTAPARTPARQPISPPVAVAKPAPLVQAPPQVRSSAPTTAASSPSAPVDPTQFASAAPSPAFESPKAVALTSPRSSSRAVPAGIAAGLAVAAGLGVLTLRFAPRR